MFRRKNPTDDDTPETGEAATPPRPETNSDTLPPAARPRVPGTVPDVGRRAIDIGTPAAIRAAAAQARRPKETKKLVVGREISLSGEITACDTLVVEGRVEATLENSELLEITPAALLKDGCRLTRPLSPVSSMVNWWFVVGCWSPPEGGSSGPSNMAAWWSKRVAMSAAKSIKLWTTHDTPA